MTTVRNTGEVAAAAGTAVDATTPGTPDAFTTFAGTPTYTATAVHGIRGFQVSAPSTYFGWTGVTGAATAGTAFRVYVYVPAAPPTNDQALLYFRSTGGGTGLFTLLHRSGGTLRCNSDAVGAVGTTTGTLPLAQWVRVEIGFTDATTTTGSLTLKCYLGDSTTEISNLALSLSGINLGTSACGTVRIGRATAATDTYAPIFDDVAFQTGSATLIGPPVSNVAPTAGAGADQINVEPWATVALSGSDSDSDGTVVTRTWAQTAGTPTVALSGSGATRTFVAPGTLAGTTLTFTYTVTDNAGASTSDSMTVAVLPVTERAVIGGVEVPMQIRET